MLGGSREETKTPDLPSHLFLGVSVHMFECVSVDGLTHPEGTVSRQASVTAGRGAEESHFPLSDPREAFRSEDESSRLLSTWGPSPLSCRTPNKSRQCF